MKKTFRLLLLLLPVLILVACDNAPKEIVKSSKIEAEIINKNIVYGQVAGVDHYVIISTKETLPRKGKDLPVTKEYIKMRILSDYWTKEDALKENARGVEKTLLKEIIKSITQNQSGSGTVQYLCKPGEQQVQVTYNRWCELKQASLRIDADDKIALQYSGRVEELQQVLETIERI